MAKTTRVAGVSGHVMAKHGGTFLGHLLGGVLSKIIVTVVVAAVAAYVGAVKVAHWNPFASNTTISTTVVLGKLVKIE